MSGKLARIEVDPHIANANHDLPAVVIAADPQIFFILQEMAISRFTPISSTDLEVSSATSSEEGSQIQIKLRSRECSQKRPEEAMKEAPQRTGFYALAR